MARPSITTSTSVCSRARKLRVRGSTSFGDEHVERLREIKAPRAQGLGLGEIRQRLQTRLRPRTARKAAATARPTGGEVDAESPAISRGRAPSPR
ncbi:MerR family transcriptional regulator [Nannocystis punicea]|uniref:MerR family transcriptional regulator n=1 Tax=Nannocystis punicea TaxID=2995304 RepID=UPI003530C845